MITGKWLQLISRRRFDGSVDDKWKKVYYWDIRIMIYLPLIAFGRNVPFKPTLISLSGKELEYVIRFAS